METLLITAQKFLNDWVIKNKDAGIELLLEPKSQLFYSPIGKMNNGLVLVRNFDNPGKSVGVSRNSLLSMNEYSEKINFESDKSQEKVRLASEKSQEFIIENSKSYQNNFKGNSNDNQTEIISNSSIDLTNVNTQLARYQKSINNLSKKVANTSNQNLKDWVYTEVEKMQFAIADGDIQTVKNIRKKLVLKLNQQKLAKKNRIHLRPEKSPEQIIREHREVMKLILSSAFIQHATNKYYKNYLALPDNTPNEIVKAINNTKIKHPDGKKYTKAIINTIRVKYAEYLTIRQQRMKRKLTFLSIFVAVILIPASIIFFVNKNNTGGLAAETQIQILYTPTLLDSMIDNYCINNDTTLTDWRKNHIHKKLDNTQATEKDIIIQITKLSKYK